MSIPALFDFANSAILLLSVTALILAFVYMYASAAEENK
jgi:hypothetical protein